MFDNGSDDGPYEILLNEYAGRARVLQLHDVTVAALRNRGAALAEGEFLSFIDSDCIMDPAYFEQALQVLRERADATGSKHALPEAPIGSRRHGTKSMHDVGMDWSTTSTPETS